jgi:dienelactone hydrolase
MFFSAAMNQMSVGQQKETSASWIANPEVVEEATKRSSEANYVEANVPPYTLPDPLVAGDGSRVTKETWPARRAEILELFRQHVYGRAPVEKPPGLAFKTLEEEADDLGGRATRRLVEISFDTPHAGRFKFPAQLYLPNAVRKPVPAVILLQFNGLTDPITPVVIDRGYALAIFDRNGVAADDKDKFREGVINAFSGDGPLAGDGWRAIAAWAWGASRVADYLETEPAIDRRRIGVTGHSRMGKTALWAGATDERFAAVLSNNSGCGGAALARRVFGETVGRINSVFPHWFCENHHRYNDREADLPVDQHMLLAVIAPRAVYVTSADEDLWADPRGEFLSCAHASPVYQLLGASGLGTQEMPALDHPIASGRIGYHVRRGRHAFTEYDWQRFLDFESNASQSR